MMECTYRDTYGVCFAYLFDDASSILTCCVACCRPTCFDTARVPHGDGDVERVGIEQVYHKVCLTYLVCGSGAEDASRRDSFYSTIVFATYLFWVVLTV